MLRQLITLCSILEHRVPSAVFGGLRQMGFSRRTSQIHPAVIPRCKFLLQTSRRRRWLGLFLTLFSFIAIALISGCAVSSSHSTPPPPVTVTVSPGTASLFLGQTQPFTATVTNASSTAVTWSVNGVPGGNSALGTIDPSSGADAATYTAPQILPSPSKLTITATSQADPSANATANLQIQSDISVSIAPTSASLATNATQSFTATVTGSGNPNIAVTWSGNGIAGGNPNIGTIISTAADAAAYCAPANVPSPPTVTITATSVADSSKSASASVTITCAPSISLTPATASVSTGAAQIFSASLCVSPGASLVWDVNGVSGGNSTLGTITPSSSNPSSATYSVVAAGLGGWTCDPARPPARFDGSYTIGPLPVGRSYQIYAEPFVGIVSPNDVAGGLVTLCASSASPACTVPAVITNFSPGPRLVP
jgi:hypothetical protein